MLGAADRRGWRIVLKGTPMPGPEFTANPSEVERLVMANSAVMNNRAVAFGDAAPRHGKAWIAPGAVLVGDVVVHAGASIWYGAVLRADSAQIVVGQESNLQDNCVVHGDPGYPATIGERVSVGHGAVIHGCTVEDDCLIGMSCTIMNGARIGAGSIVAAGAVVLAGVQVPPGSLVAGVPAAARRDTTESERSEILANARHYVGLAAQHADALDNSTQSGDSAGLSVAGTGASRRPRL